MTKGVSRVGRRVTDVGMADGAVVAAIVGGEIDEDRNEDRDKDDGKHRPGKSQRVPRYPERSR